VDLQDRDVVVDLDREVCGHRVIVAGSYARRPSR
jgi:hypothetical protein